MCSIFVLLSLVSSASAGANFTVCGTSAQLSADPLNADEIGIWTTITGSGTFSNSSSPMSSVTGLLQGNNTLRWTVTNTVTSSVVGSNVIVRNNSPSISVITGASRRNSCVINPSFSLTGSLPINGIGTWTVVSGMASFSAPNFRITNLSGLNQGSNIVAWVIRNGECLSTSTVNAYFNKPASAGIYQEVCGTTATLSASDNGVAVSYNWYDPSFNLSFDDDADPNTNVSGLIPGPNVFQWNTIDGNSCVTQITITSNIVTPSNAGSNQTLCSNATTLIGNAASLGTGQWNFLTSASGFSFANQSLAGTSLTNIPEGSSILEWKISKGICESATTVAITNNAPTPSSIAGGNQDVCLDNTTIAGNAPTQGVGRWTKVLGAGVVVFPNSPVTSITGLLAGSVSSYMWTVSFPGCPSSNATVTVSRQSPEIAKVQTNYLSFCGSNFATVVGVNTASGVWAITAGPGSIVGANSNKTAIIDLGSDGRTKLSWTLNILGCSTTTDTVTIDHSAVSLATVTGSRNFEICTDTLFLTGVYPVKGIGSWSFLAGGGLLTDVNLHSTLGKNLNAGINRLRWTVINDFCSSFVNVTITNNKPALALAVPDNKIVCSNSDVLFATSVAGPNVGVWTTLAGSGTIGSAGAANNKIVSNLGLGANTFLWTVTLGSCTSKDTLTLTNNTPIGTFAGNNQIVCTNITTLTGSALVQGVGFWSNSSTGTGVFLESTNPKTTVTGLASGPNVLLWTVTTPGCPATISPVRISNNQVTVPVASVANDCFEVNTATSAIIYLNANQPLNTITGEFGIWRTITSPGITNIATPTLASTTATGIGGSGFYRFGWRITAPGCSLEATTQAVVLSKAITGTDLCLKINAGVPDVTSVLSRITNPKPSQGEYAVWSYVSTSFTPNISNLTLNATTGGVSGLEKGVHTFQYLVGNTNNLSCQSTATILGTVLTKANAGTNLCFTDINTATVIANSSNPVYQTVGERGVWTTTGLASIDQLGIYSGSVTGYISNLQDGVNAFSFTTSNDNNPSCTDVSNVQITKLTQPTITGITDFLLATLAGGNATIVLNGNVANSSVGETAQWNIVTVSGAGTGILPNVFSPTITITGLKAGLNKFSWAINNTLSGCINSLNKRDTFNVYVQTKAVASTLLGIVYVNSNPGVGLARSITPNTIVSSAGEVGTWNLVSSFASTIPNSTVGIGNVLNLTNLNRGVYIYHWTIENSNFTGYSNSSEVTITGITKAIAGDNLCIKDTLTNADFELGNAQTLAISPIDNEVFSWTSNNSLLGIGFNPNQAQPLMTVTGLPIGRTFFTFTVTNTVSGVSDQSTILVTKITNPYLGNDTLVCGNNYQLKPLKYPNTNLGESFAWTKSSGIASITGFGLEPTVFLNGISTSGFNYRIFNTITIISQPSCFFSDNINVRSNAPSPAKITTINNVVVCSPEVLLNATVPGQGFGQWSLISSMVGQNIVSPLLESTSVTGLAQGRNVFQWTVTTSGCPPSFDVVTIANNKITIPTVGSDICTTVVWGTNTLLSFSGNTPAIGEIGIWRALVAPTIAGIVFQPNSNTPNVTVGGLASGFYRFGWAITDVTSTCGLTATISGTIVPLASTTGQNACLTMPLGSTELSATLTSPNILNVSKGEVGTWTIISNPGSPSLVVNSVTGLVSGLRKGVHVFAYTVSNTNASSCINSNSKSTPVSVITKADAGADTCIAGMNTITIIGNRTNFISPVAGGVGTWTGTDIFTTGDLTSVTGIASNLQDGLNKFYFTVFNTNQPSCKSIDSILVNKHTKAYAGLDSFQIALPQNGPTTSLQLNANSLFMPNESASWIPIASPSASFVPATNVANATVNGMSIGVNKLQWQINNTANTSKTCVSRDTVAVFVQTKADLGNIQYIFKNATPTISGLSTIISALNAPVPPVGEYGVWELISTNAPQNPTSVVGVGANQKDISLGNLRRGVSAFSWTIYNSNFPSGKFNSDTVLVTVMTKALAGPDSCIKDGVFNLNLGSFPTVPIRTASNERFSWASSNSSVVGLSYDGNSNIPEVTVSNLPKGITYLYFTITNTGSGAFDSDTVKITKVSTPLFIDKNISQCDTLYPLKNQTVADFSIGEVYTWKKLNGKSKFDDISLPEPTVSPLDTGNNKFSFAIYNQNSGTECTLIDTINIRNDQPYFVTITGLDISTFRINQLRGNNPKLQFPSATSEWSLVTQPGANVINNIQLLNQNTPILNVLNMVSTGDYEFQYLIRNAFCILRTNFVIFRDNRIDANQGIGGDICGDTFVLNADTLGEGETGIWTDPGGAGIISDVTNPRATITGIAQTKDGNPENEFQWQRFKGEAKSSVASIFVRSFLNPSKANLGRDLSFCETFIVTLTNFQTVPGIIGNPTWKITEGIGTFSGLNTTTGSVLLSNIGYKSNTVVLEILNGSACPVSKDTLIVTRDEMPELPDLGLGSGICTDTFLLEAPIPNIGIGMWSQINTTTSTFATPQNNITKVYDVIPGVKNYKWEVVNGQCTVESFISNNIGVKPTKAIIFANDTAICDTATIRFRASTPVVGTASWQALNSGNTITANTTLFTDYSLGLVKNFGENKFLYTIKVTSDIVKCSSTDSITINAAQPPTMAKLNTSDTLVCYNEILLNGNIPIVGQSQWLIPANLNATIIGNSLYTNSLQPGISALSYNISVPGCPVSSANITVSNVGFTKAEAGTDTTVCGENFQLGAIQPVIGSGFWSKLTGTATFVDNTQSNTFVNGLQKGENKLIWTKFTDVCPTTSDTLIVRNNKVDPINAFGEITVFTPSYNLTAIKPESGIGKWWVLKGNSVLSDPENPTSSLDNISIGENIVRWTVKNAGCDSAFADQKIILSDLKIPIGFSPNKDGVNEKFEIVGIDSYPNSSLEVFNRWGKVVYKASNYKNNWEGTNTENEPLLEDSYFYIIKVNEDKKPITGFVQIKR